MAIGARTKMQVLFLAPYAFKQKEFMAKNEPWEDIRVDMNMRSTSCTMVHIDGCNLQVFAENVSV